MTEIKRNILIASLGDSPGVVTSAVDALQREGVIVNKVITLSTQNKYTCLKDRNGELLPAQNGYVELLNNEFSNYPGKIKYIYDCIGSSDIENKSECEDFLGLAAKYINQYQQEGYDVYVCIAGGRKSMSALLTIAVQFYGAKALFHISITDVYERKYIDNNVTSDLRLLRGENGKRILHPKSAEIVKLPFCDLSSFTKSELGSVEDGLLNTLFKFCEKISNKMNGDIPKINDPTKLEQ